MLGTEKDVEYALHELAKKQIFISKKEAEMNTKIEQIKQKFTEETKEASGEYDDLKSEIEAWCVKNSLKFQKVRSLEWAIGKIGFRTNPPKVVTLNKKTTLKTALELIKKVFDGNYVRTKEEIDKETILQDYSQKRITDDKLAGVGLRIEQDETFFVEIDYEKIKDFKKAV